MCSFRHLGHVQDDLTQVGVGLHVLVRGLRLLEPVELAVDDDGKVAAEARQGYCGRALRRTWLGLG